MVIIGVIGIADGTIGMSTTEIAIIMIAVIITVMVVVIIEFIDKKRLFNLYCRAPREAPYFFDYL
jgi:hypothetical protein